MKPDLKQMLRDALLNAAGEIAGLVEPDIEIGLLLSSLEYHRTSARDGISRVPSQRISQAAAALKSLSERLAVAENDIRIGCANIDREVKRADDAEQALTASEAEATSLRRALEEHRRALEEIAGPEQPLASARYTEAQAIARRALSQERGSEEKEPAK